MAVVGILALYLTGLSRQQVLQGPKTVLDPVAPLPCPDEPWPADVSLQTEQVVQRHTGLMDDNEGHCPIRWTGGPQPHITHCRHVRLSRQGQSRCCCKSSPLTWCPSGSAKV